MTFPDHKTSYKTTINNQDNEVLDWGQTRNKASHLWSIVFLTKHLRQFNGRKNSLCNK